MSASRTSRVAVLALLAAIACVPGQLALAAHRTARAGAAERCANTSLRPTRSNLAAVRSAVLCLINRERVDHGLMPLRFNRHLQRAAQLHTRSMVRRDYFSHYGPSGETPMSRIRAAGFVRGRVSAVSVGENIGWGTLWLDTPAAMVAGWMASPGHRANILDREYTETGIGALPALPASVARAHHRQRGALYTQDFGTVVAS